MEKEQVVAMLNDVLKRLKELQDVLVTVQLWAMDREMFWYSGRAEQAGDYLYFAQKEVEELLGLECEEL